MEFINNAPRPGESVQPTGIHPHYIVRLHVAGDTSLDRAGRRLFPMEANMPDKISFGIDSSWDTPFMKFSEGVDGAFERAGPAGAAVQTGMQASGLTTKFKHASAQVWQSSSPLSFTFPFQFVAETDPRIDVIDKIKALMKLQAPSEGPGGILIAPGPTLASMAAESLKLSDNSRVITLRIGNMMELSPAIIKSVTGDIDALMHSSAAPMSASVNVTVESFFTSVTVDDIDKLFKV